MRDGGEPGWNQVRTVSTRVIEETREPGDGIDDPTTMMDDDVR